MESSKGRSIGAKDRQQYRHATEARTYASARSLIIHARDGAGSQSKSGRLVSLIVSATRFEACACAE
jgi:hypothetical protein